MNTVRVCILFAFLPSLTIAQASDLAQQQELLTRDCKNVRGHAGRVVEETSQSDLNTDLARAHAGEVVKNLRLMEQRLQAIKKLYNKDQSTRVRAEQASMEKACEMLKNLSGRLEQELEKEMPDRLQARKIAMELRTEMNKGYDVHQQMKKKLGLK
ncbi:MAG: hypothetical protein WEB62_02900 [Bacteroidota bacterium]